MILKAKQPNLKWKMDLNKGFSKEDTQMINSHIERCSTLLAIRKTQIKTTMRHYTPTRMAVSKTIENNRCWQVYEETAILEDCWWKCKIR